MSEWLDMASIFGIAIIGIVVGSAVGGVFLAWLERKRNPSPEITYE